MASSQEKYQIILEAREAAAEKIKKLKTQIDDLGGPAMVKSQREVNKLERELKLLNQSADKGHPIFTRFTSGIAIGTIAANAAMAAFSALTGFLKGTLNAALDSEQAWNDVAASLKRHGDSVYANLPAVKTLGNEMMHLAGVADEEVAVAFRRIYDISGDVQQSMNLTRSAMDLAAGKGMELESAADLVAKAISGEDVSLGKLRISIDKTLPKQQQIAELQATINEHFGGAAQAAMDTTGGKIKELGLVFEELQESIGKALSESTSFRVFLESIKDAVLWIAGTPIDTTSYEQVTARIKELTENIRLYTSQGITGPRVKVETEELERLQRVLDDILSNTPAGGAADLGNMFKALEQSADSAETKVKELKATLQLTENMMLPAFAEEFQQGLEDYQKALDIAREKARTAEPLLPPEAIFGSPEDLAAATAGLNDIIKSQINADIIGKQQAEFNGAFKQIGTQGIHNLAAALASGEPRIGDVFAQMAQSFKTLFIEETLKSIVMIFIPKIVKFLGGIFDTPSNDRMLLQQGRDAAHYFGQGYMAEMKRNSPTLNGVMPRASNLAMPAMAAPAPAASGGSTINVTFSGNVLSHEFIERQVAPTLRKLVTNGKSDLVLNPENVTGGRNIRVY